MAAPSTTVLALDSASHAVRQEDALLDALPYVDPLDPAEAAAAEAAIRQEVRVWRWGWCTCVAHPVLMWAVWGVWPRLHKAWDWEGVPRGVGVVLGVDEREWAEASARLGGRAGH
jgi:hypothetical protein